MLQIISNSYNVFNLKIHKGTFSCFASSAIFGCYDIDYIVEEKKNNEIAATSAESHYGVCVERLTIRKIQIAVNWYSHGGPGTMSRASESKMVWGWEGWDGYEKI